MKNNNCCSRFQFAVIFSIAIFLSACGSGGGGGGSSPASNTDPASNTAPVSNAGQLQNIIVGTVVTLNGNASSDANGDPLTYSWTLTSKPAISTATLSGSTSATPTFTADVAGSYVATLVVNDGQVNSVASTVILVAATNITNLLASPNDLSTASWIGTGGILRTNSTLTFDGTGAEQVYQQWMTWTAGHQYLFVFRANTPSSIHDALIFTYPRLYLRCYQNGAGQLISDDDKFEGSYYTIGLRSTTENHFARYTATTDGLYIFMIQDNAGNTDGIEVNYAFAAVYDITGLSGTIIDNDDPQYFNLDKQIHAWGDSLTSHLVWRLRERSNFVNATGHTFGGQNSSYVLTQFLAAPDTWKYPTVIWAGHNNVGDVAQVENDIKAMTDRLTGDFRVLSLVYRKAWVDPVRASEADDADAVNAWLASTYGSKYVDVKTALLAGSDGSPQDQADVAKGLTPTSLRSDDIHINAGGYDYVADAINASIGTAWSK